MSVSKILLDNINNKELSINLSESEILYLKHLIEEKPEIFFKISENIKNITANGKLDLHDIPQVILLISNIYNAHIVSDLIKNVNITNIVEFTINSILDSGIIPLPNFELFIIKKIVDGSLELLKINISVIKKEDKYCCFSFFNMF